MRMWAVPLIAAGIVACASAPGPPPRGPQADLSVWREFVDVLRAGPFPAERVRPYQPELLDGNLGALEIIRQQARAAELKRTPEVFRVGRQLHYLLPLTLESGKATYTFTFLVDGDRWYFQHLDAIAIRLDRLGSLPVSSFPDVPEDTKAWMRAEYDVTRQVWLYQTLKAEKGVAEARKWLTDGAGYALAARVWIPFVSPERAFVLYLCWEQANLRGGRVTLERLEDSDASVRLTPAWFLLYRISGHLRQQIAIDEYRDLFEYLWRDRARNAGWSVEFSYTGDEVVMHLSRARAAAPEG